MAAKFMTLKYLGMSRTNLIKPSEKDRWIDLGLKGERKRDKASCFCALSRVAGVATAATQVRLLHVRTYVWLAR